MIFSAAQCSQMIWGLIHKNWNTTSHQGDVEMWNCQHLNHTHLYSVSNVTTTCENRIWLMLLLLSWSTVGRTTWSKMYSFKKVYLHPSFTKYLFMAALSLRMPHRQSNLVYCCVPKCPGYFQTRTNQWGHLFKSMSMKLTRILYRSNE